MTQKDKLLNDIGMPDAEETLKPILDGYAIGRWVSVSERLPEFDQGCFGGHVIVQGLPGKNGTVESDIFPDDMFANGEITHWLDLDVPTKKGANDED